MIHDRTKLFFIKQCSFENKQANKNELQKRPLQAQVGELGGRRGGGGGVILLFNFMTFSRFNDIFNV